MRLPLPSEPARARSLPSAGVLFALAVTLVLACRSGGAPDEEDDNQFRDDVIWCEEAVARLERCCPGFDGRRVECMFYFSHDEGCGSSETYQLEPAFTKDESSCIHDTTCEELVAAGVCERAAQSGAGRSTTTTTSSTSSGFVSGTSSTSGSPPRPRVCP